MRRLVQLSVFFLFLLFAWSQLSHAGRAAGDEPLAFTDSLVAAYKAWPDKGEAKNKRRATILCKSNTIAVNETLTVYHVYEEMKKGRYYSIVDHKAVCSEYVDDALSGCPGDSSYTWFWFCDCGNFDSLIVMNQAETAGPAIITNFDNTKYVFNRPGTHRIRWQPGEQVSNTLVITVKE